MNKKDFIMQLSKKSGLSKTDSRNALDSMLDLIVGSCKKKQKVTFTGFGTFEARKQKSTQRIAIVLVGLVIAVALAAVRFYAWPGSVITWKETPGMSGGFVEVR